MTPDDARPSGCTRYTPFEKELVNAMRDFANNADAPDFAPAAIVRGARRRMLSLVMAGITAVIILGGAGTALAVTAHSGPAATSNPATGSSHTATRCGPTATSHPYTGAPHTTSSPETGCGSTGTSCRPTSASSPHTGSSPSGNSNPETGCGPTGTSHPATGSSLGVTGNPATGS
jgi:hypothetical protein